jgi:hypothetical protein
MGGDARTSRPFLLPKGELTVFDTPHGLESGGCSRPTGNSSGASHPTRTGPLYTMGLPGLVQLLVQLLVRLVRRRDGPQRIP